MSVFKDYFFTVLRWPLIHRLGPLAVLVEGLARVLDKTREDIIWLRNQFNPWTCDESMIVAHAESRGITRHPAETADKYKERCIRAFAWHRLGGGQIGMPQILAHFGYPDTKILNVRAEDPMRWAEFKPRLSADKGLSAQDYQLVGWIADETKPARSKLAGIQARSTVSGGVNTSATTLTLVKVILTPERPDSILVPGAIFSGGYTHSVIRTYV